MPLQLNTFLDAMLANVPEDKKAAVRAEYSKAQDAVKAAETTLDETTKAVQKTAKEQSDWWKAHENDVAELERLKAHPATTGGVDAAEFDKKLGALRAETLETGLGLGLQRARDQRESGDYCSGWSLEHAGSLNRMTALGDVHLSCACPQAALLYAQVSGGIPDKLRYKTQ